MLKIRSNLDLSELLASVQSLPHVVDGTGILMTFAPNKGIHDSFLTAADEIGALRGATPLHLMVNTVLPNGGAPMHTDVVEPRGKHYERWHLPLLTNEGCLLNGEHLASGFWHGPFAYWEPHDLQNKGSTSRIHLIVDLDKEV